MDTISAKETFEEYMNKYNVQHIQKVWDSCLKLFEELKEERIMALKEHEEQPENMLPYLIKEYINPFVFLKELEVTKFDVKEWDIFPIFGEMQFSREDNIYNSFISNAISFKKIDEFGLFDTEEIPELHPDAIELIKGALSNFYWFLLTSYHGEQLGERVMNVERKANQTHFVITTMAETVYQYQNGEYKLAL